MSIDETYPVNTNLDTPLISIIMNCYNGEKYLRAAIDSVYAQTYKNWEIIFWDNCSTDRSAEIAQLYDEKLKYFKCDNTIALYAARNLALEQCQGQAIAFLDSDDLWVPNKLELQIPFFKQGAACVFGKFKNIGPDGMSTGFIQNKCAFGYITDVLLRRNLISIGCVLANADLIKKYRFDDFYELLGDFDLWIRISVDHKILCVPHILEFSRQHDSNTSNTKSKLWSCERRHFYRKFISNEGLLRYPSIFLFIIKAEIKGLLNIR